MFLLQASYPSEILDLIMQSLLRIKHCFSTIASFSMVSYQFRQVALKRYFTRLIITSSVEWAALRQAMDVMLWVR